MGHSAAIQCPNCSAIRKVELKEVSFHDIDATLTYTFVCDCGYSHAYVDTPLTEIEGLLSGDSETNQVAQWLGISPESYASYIWPLDVRLTIDKERRKLPESRAKRDLRAAALALPKQLDERWWIVYEYSHTIVFDPRNNTYGFVVANGSVIEVDDIAAVIAKLT